MNPNKRGFLFQIHFCTLLQDSISDVISLYCTCTIFFWFWKFVQICQFRFQCFFQIDEVRNVKVDKASLNRTGMKSFNVIYSLFTARTWDRNMCKGERFQLNKTCSLI